MKMDHTQFHFPSRGRRLIPLVGNDVIDFVGGSGRGVELNGIHHNVVEKRRIPAYMIQSRDAIKAIEQFWDHTQFHW
jgi:hypothetical protein